MKGIMINETRKRAKRVSRIEVVAENGSKSIVDLPNIIVQLSIIILKVDRGKNIIVSFIG